jgi:Ca2+-binding RTX toxin-like protein
MRSFAKGCVGLGAIVAALLAPSLATAGTAFVANDGVAYYDAAPGEANDVTVTQDGFNLTNLHLVDLGAPLTAGDGCQSVSEHEVTCLFSPNSGLLVSLDDLDDSYSAAAMKTSTRWSGGDGNDTAQGGQGVDELWGEAGDDTIRTGAGADPGEEQGNLAYGGDGNDTLIGGSYSDLLRGGAGDDSVTGNGGHDTVVGGKGNDSVSGGRLRDNVGGGEGHDTLSGNGGNDWLYAQDGLHDTVKGGRGFDHAEVDRRLDTVRSVGAFF